MQLLQGDGEVGVRRAGRRRPEGRTAYVLTKDLLKKETTLWNASTGKSYTTELLHCPLTSVGLVFDDTNIWANVQPYDEPHLIDWHFDDARNWRPFFGGRGGFAPGVSATDHNHIKIFPVAAGCGC